MTKLVAADEISAYVEPRRAMAVLSHVGKPLQAQDTLFMTEWVAIFRESGLRDDVSVDNLRDSMSSTCCLCKSSSSRTSSRCSSGTSFSCWCRCQHSDYLLKVDPRLRWSSLCVSSSSRLKVASLGMRENISILARMASVFDVVQRGIHYLPVHDLQRPSLAVSQSNRLRVKDVLHRPRHWRNLPRMPRLWHSLKRMVLKAKGKGIQEGQVFYQVFYKAFYHAF